MSDIRVIIGLGNPGSEYEQTRHNVGFMAVDLLAQKLAIDIKQKKFASLVGETLYKDKKLILVKPQQYMNRSGQAVATIKGFYKLEDSQLMVITDDMALAPGVIRLKPKGSPGGHNGLKDILNKIGTAEFPRLRIGIGKSPFPDSKNHVLGKIAPAEVDDVKDSIEKTVQAVFCWLDHGIDSAMNQFNQKNVNEDK